MNRPFIKTSVVTLISLVLLYYSVAWAVVRCFHDEHHANSEITLSDVDQHNKGIFLSAPSRALAYLDCMGPDYHTESLAGSSSLSQMLRLTVNITSRLDNIQPWQNVAGEHARDIRLRAVFDRLSPPTFSRNSSRCLYLSSLRI
jgi:hypothetical protein